MKDNPLKKLCKIYLTIGIFAYVLALLAFALLSPIPLGLHIFIISVGIVPFTIMLISIIKHERAYLFVKAIIPYILIVKLTGMATVSNGLESSALLFFFVTPFLIYSLEENIILPSIIMVFIVTFFVYCHSSPFLYEALNKIDIIDSKTKLNDLNFAYIIFFYLVLLINFVQSHYYVKTQTSYSRIINQKHLELCREKNFKENMLINATHEIKTPHTIIKNSFQTLSQSFPEIKKSPLFPAINRQLERVIKDASDIFDEAKLSISEKIYDHNRVFCLSCFLKEKALLFSSYAATKEITIERENIESNLYIKAADVAIDKVINNLLDNAIKYSPGGGKIEIMAQSKADKIELTIRDSGIGISPEDLANLFLRFYQVTKKKEVSRGVGLGLFLVKQILDTLGASIEIKSEENRGTTVYIEFERYREERGLLLENYSISSPSFCPDMFKEVEDSKYDKSLQTIMIVEDEPAIARILKEAMEEQYNIVTAANGKIALRKLKEKRVNLIISDIMMPLMNGLELCSEIKSRAEYKNIPFIFITARSGDSEKLKGLKAGAIDYISKPFNSTEVYLRVKNNLKLHELLIESSRTEIIDELENNYQEKLAQLPPRQKQICDLLYYHPFITNREIADSLDIKQGSVGRYIKDITRKFELSSERKSELINFLRKYRSN